MTCGFEVYQMPEHLGGDWAVRVQFEITDGFATEEEARAYADARLRHLRASEPFGGSE